MLEADDKKELKEYILKIKSELAQVGLFCLYSRSLCLYSRSLELKEYILKIKSELAQVPPPPPPTFFFSFSF
jgi:hypothetical protein